MRTLSLPPLQIFRLDTNERRFWGFECVFWLSYGAVLMLPWLGRYSIVAMLPNKLLIAATGLIATLAVRYVAERNLKSNDDRWSSRALLAVAATTVIAGLLWDSFLTVALGKSVELDRREFGTLIGGVPQLSGLFSHIIVLSAAVLGWLVIRSASSIRVSDSTLPGSASGGAILPQPDRIRIQDGRKTIVLGVDEINWLQAEGDYVRIHTSSRRLLVRATLASTDAALPQDSYLRIHRSVIVRIAFVRELHGRPNNELDVVLRDGTRLRASRNYSDKLRSAVASIASGFVGKSYSHPESGKINSAGNGSGG
jgi:hypothetical protein